jgi:predicted DNA-binding protein
MGDMETYSTKLPENTADWFEEYVDNEGVTKAAALRQIVEKEQHRSELAEEFADATRANQAKIADKDTLTLVVSTLTLLLVAGMIL